MMLSLRGLGSALTDQIADAITRQEGATQNNNPGNLIALPNYTYPGQVGTDYRGFAVFDSYDSGMAQLDRQIDLNISRGLTLEEFFCGKPGVYGGYAPGSQCAPYVADVSSWTGIPASQDLDSYSGFADPATGSDWTGIDYSADGGIDSGSSWIPIAAVAGVVGLVLVSAR